MRNVARLGIARTVMLSGDNLRVARGSGRGSARAVLVARAAPEAAETELLPDLPAMTSGRPSRLASAHQREMVNVISMPVNGPLATGSSALTKAVTSRSVMGCVAAAIFWNSLAVGL